jgi:hypothetical protein
LQRISTVALVALGVQQVGIPIRMAAQEYRIVIPQVRVARTAKLDVLEDQAFNISPDPAARISGASLRLRLIRTTKASMDSLAKRPHAPGDTCVTFYNTFVYNLQKIDNDHYTIGFAAGHQWLKGDAVTKIFAAESFVVVLEEKGPDESDDLYQPLRLLRSAIPDYLQFAVEMTVRPVRTGPRDEILFGFADATPAVTRLPCLGVTIRTVSIEARPEGFLTACGELTQPAVSGTSLSGSLWKLYQPHQTFD